MPEPRFFFAVALYCLMFTGLAQSAERNILFVITDDESPTLGCYGDPVAVTPHVDSIARDGTLFRNAFATTASCSASRSVILSGLHNHLNGQYGHEHDFHHFTSFADVISLSLPRALTAAGYRTAICGKFHVGPEQVYHFEQKLPGNPRSTVAMAESCRKFLTDSQTDRPFFLYFATADPHRSGKDGPSEHDLKPNLFGNQPDRRAYPQVQEIFFDPAKIPVPPFLPDTPECREELAQYYQATSRVDQGLGRLIEILKSADLYDKTLIVFTSDHGMAMPGAKTTVYDPGLQVPLVIRNPYESKRGIVSDAMISHVDMAPSLIDFAGALDPQKNRPNSWTDPEDFWKQAGERQTENRSGGHTFTAYQGASWLPILGDTGTAHRDTIYASHTFHEIQMYYPMRAIRDRKYKLIWNIASGLPYPFASDLWIASTWQAQYQLGPQAPFGKRTVGEYIHRPRFELYDIAQDPNESRNLADDPAYAQVLADYQQRLKEFQKACQDPWITKWDYE
jgi:N-sulfoglucosamine sulfohydrolase